MLSLHYSLSQFPALQPIENLGLAASQLLKRKQFKQLSEANPRFFARCQQPLRASKQGTGHSSRAPLPPAAGDLQTGSLTWVLFNSAKCWDSSSDRAQSDPTVLLIHLCSKARKWDSYHLVWLWDSTKSEMLRYTLIIRLTAQLLYPLHNCNRHYRI